MVESLIKQDKRLLGTSYLRRWRNQIQVDESRAAVAHGLTEEYRTLIESYHQRELLEQRCKVRRQDILLLTAIRYDPSLREGLRIQNFLFKISDDETFDKIFEAIIRVQDFDQFYTIVEVAASEQSMVNAI